MGSAPVCGHHVPWRRLARRHSPAWRLASRDVQQVLRGTGPATTADRGGLRARAALLAVQVALSVTLLAATMLLAVSFVRVLRVDRGFMPDDVLAVDVTLPGVRYSARQPRVDVYDRILAGVSALPGVDSAAWTSNLPLTGESWVDAILPRDSSEVPREIPVANYRFVSPDFFRVLSVPVTGGRSLVATDLDTTRAATAAVISRRTAERMWPGNDPIGRRFMRGDPTEKPFEVVGVCADGYPSRLDAAPPMMVYVPYTYRSRTRAALVIRASGDLPSMDRRRPQRDLAGRPRDRDRQRATDGPDRRCCSRQPSISGDAVRGVRVRGALHRHARRLWRDGLRHLATSS
jgi:putative ABC transport system permease protein